MSRHPSRRSCAGFRRAPPSRRCVRGLLIGVALAFLDPVPARAAGGRVRTRRSRKGWRRLPGGHHRSRRAVRDPADAAHAPRSPCR
ncbi:MAG: hypothetical protein MZV65_25195 [Chromatiales bacterium]|nr:hypothetical protein [Chromatiales bacterium]